jgi:hypothetical protein
VTGEGAPDPLDHDQANRELVSFRQEWLAEISDLQTDAGHAPGPELIALDMNEAAVNLGVTQAGTAQNEPRLESL